MFFLQKSFSALMVKDILSISVSFYFISFKLCLKPLYTGPAAITASLPSILIDAILPNCENNKHGHSIMTQFDKSLIVW